MILYNRIDNLSKNNEVFDKSKSTRSSGQVVSNKLSFNFESKIKTATRKRGRQRKIMHYNFPFDISAKQKSRKVVCLLDQ